MEATKREAYGTDEARWEAVRSRDAAAAGAFLYAVSTTGIYCRPACSSRLPRRDHVRFFDSRTEAERAGFRPCRRCRPDRPSGSSTEALLRRACALLDDPIETPGLDQVAEAVSLSPAHFHRVFTEGVGITPAEYAAARRRSRLQEALPQARTATDAIYNAGFSSPSRVYENPGDVLGMTPARYRAGGAGETIRYSVTEGSLGPVLVAATERGLCMVEFGEPEALERRVRDRFAHATMRPGDAAFAELVRQVVALVDEPGRSLDLPLDVRGTAFQQRVWKALRATRAGQQVSYSELAAAIGSPAAARAVAGACAANPVAVVIPCHRVVPKGGSVGGYRWGEARKRALLERERP